ncbi:MAG: DUF262 domain-containing protein [Sphingomonas sp.]|nr:DUF262 domain-containing protein [Sphingomonas sp.]
MGPLERDFTSLPLGAQHPTEEWDDMASSSRNVVNLDALIQRADLLSPASTVTGKTHAIRISDLQTDSAIYDMLRKPDFQRETANWSPQQVAILIQTFAEQDLIPSMILWQNGPHIFVVDGAHRLSALVAWVRDDYGAGVMSQSYFRTISSHQRAMHDKTRELVAGSVGPWEKFRATNSAFMVKGLDAQWIENREPQQVAEAFIRINRGGTEIDALEVRIVRAPRAALSVTTRAITRGGGGHSYWQHFTDAAARERVPKLGAEIYDLLFHPPLETPIKTMDVPLAGSEYNLGVVRLAFDLVALTNNIPVPDSTRRSASTADKPPPDDISGEDTVKYLHITLRKLRLILSNHKSSLGLHPALYFYTAGGSFQPAALLNMIAWLDDLEKEGRLDVFRKQRGAFETLLLAHPVIVKPATHKLGSGARTRKRMLALFNKVLGLLEANSGRGPEWAAGRTWNMLQNEFPHLASDEREQAEEGEGAQAGAKFTGKAKSAATFADLASVPRCALCGGLLHRNGKTLDHSVKRADGGSSGKGNRRWVHPRCNSERDKDERGEQKT